jgi:5-methylcytosine-specific restriction endonuclease McrA
MTRREDRVKFWEVHAKGTYECPQCGKTQEDGATFDVHHIDGNPENGDMGNLTALCRECHRDEHGMQPGKERGHWSEEYFHEWRSKNSPLRYL